MKATRTLTSLKKEREIAVSRVKLYDQVISALERLNSNTLTLQAKEMGWTSPPAKVEIRVPVRRIRARVPTVCSWQNCPRKGKEFRAKRRDRRFCSKSCQKASWWKHIKEPQTKGEQPNMRAHQAQTLVPGDPLRANGR